MSLIELFFDWTSNIIKDLFTGAWIKKVSGLNNFSWACRSATFWHFFLCILHMQLVLLVLLQLLVLLFCDYFPIIVTLQNWLIWSDFIFVWLRFVQKWSSKKQFCAFYTNSKGEDLVCLFLYHKGPKFAKKWC